MAGLIFHTFFSLPKSREWPKDKSPLLGMECRVAQSSSSPLMLLPFYVSLTITYFSFLDQTNLLSPPAPLELICLIHYLFPVTYLTSPATLPHSPTRLPPSPRHASLGPYPFVKIQLLGSRVALLWTVLTMQLTTSYTRPPLQPTGASPHPCNRTPGYTLVSHI